MTQTIVVYRGNHRTIRLTIKDPDGVAYGISGATIKMYVKKEVTDLDSEAIITLTGVIIDNGAGVVEFYLDDSDTETETRLADNTPYPVDFELTTSTDKKYTVLRTTLVILTK